MTKEAFAIPTSYHFDVPVVLLAFNRPNTTRIVFEAVRAVRPRVLLLVMDAPRLDNAEDVDRCNEVRRILEDVDWPCQVLREYAQENLGARRRVASGISWAFTHFEEAVILEDDCVPSPGFFTFCSELLERYRHDTRVMHIGGTNLASQTRRTDSSYLFSRYPVSWGWATWRRAWSLYDHDLLLWPEVREAAWIRDYFGPDEDECDQWTDRLDRIWRNEFDSWASIWMFSCWIQNALSIIPTENQIVNIGLGDADATHTSGARHSSLTREVVPIVFPLKHPRFMVRDSQTDREISRRPLLIRDFSGLRGHWRRLRALRKRAKAARQFS